MALALAAGAAAADAAAAVVVEARTDKARYLTGVETVRVEVRLTNTGPDPATLFFPDLCHATFQVWNPRDGSLVYDHEPSACGGPTGNRTLQPGESLIYPFYWGQTDGVGRLVPHSADYYIRGVILARMPMYSPFTSIRIVNVCDDGADNDSDGRVDYPADTGCSGPGDNNEALNDDDLAVEVVPRIKGYVRGEVASFDLKITNLAGEIYRRVFPSSCVGFFTVRDPSLADGLLYDLRRHAFCSAIVTELILEPGASRAVPFSWRFVDDAGQPVPSPGYYEVRASFGYPDPLRTAIGYVGLDMPCSDRLDNDGDGLIDYPNDPGCVHDIDSKELDLFREVKVEVRVDRASYPPGDEVYIDVVITNVSDREVRLNFPCYDVYDLVRFVVETPEGEPIYWPPPGICQTAIGILTLLPGQSETFYHYWPQQNNIGDPVPFPSQWIVRSVIGSIEPVPVDTAPITVGIGCSDGFDNDLDGMTDYPDDPGCAGTADTDESGSVTVSIDPAGLSWTPTPEAISYDVARLVIYPFGGPYSPDQCEADNTTDTTLPLTGVPAPGRTHAFVVRTVHAGGAGSYDSGSPFQVGSRDPIINSSWGYCP